MRNFIGINPRGKVKTENQSKEVGRGTPEQDQSDLEQWLDNLEEDVLRLNGKTIRE